MSHMYHVRRLQVTNVMLCPLQVMDISSTLLISESVRSLHHRDGGKTQPVSSKEFKGASKEKMHISGAHSHHAFPRVVTLPDTHMLDSDINHATQARLPFFLPLL